MNNELATPRPWACGEGGRIIGGGAVIGRAALSTVPGQREANQALMAMGPAYKTWVQELKDAIRVFIDGARAAGDTERVTIGYKGGAQAFHEAVVRLEKML